MMAYEHRYHDRRTVSPRAEPMGIPSYRSNDYSAPPRPRHAPAQVTPNNVLGVFGLSIRTRERDLEDEFSRYGDVEKVVIVYDQRVSQLSHPVCCQADSNRATDPEVSDSLPCDLSMMQRGRGIS